MAKKWEYLSVIKMLNWNIQSKIVIHQELGMC